MGRLFKVPSILFQSVLVCISLQSVTPGQVYSQTRQPESKASAAQRSRANLPRPELRVQKLSPDMERILIDWYKQSKNVRRLEGAHYRYVYDKVFLTEKRSLGQFWYEGPDKGRIDIQPRKLKKMKKVVRSRIREKHTL